MNTARGARQILNDKNTQGWITYEPDYLNAQASKQLIEVLILDEGWERERGRMTLSLGVKGLRYSYDQKEHVA